MMEIQIFISPCKNIIFKKKSLLKKETKILQDIITQDLISSFNTSQKHISSFTKPSYKKQTYTTGNTISWPW
jgi:hypothetical protein